MLIRNVFALSCAGLLAAAADAEKFTLLVGVNPQREPGLARLVDPLPGPGRAGTFVDGDRLAGTNDMGGLIRFQGTGEPFFRPNEFGALSFMFRRGSLPPAFGGPVPIMAIDYLGGPLLDLDGDLSNGVRSYVPVQGARPVVIPGSASFINLRFDVTGGRVELLDFDATGTNEGAQGFPAEIATVLVTPAGTGPQGQRGDPINPDIDTRTGQLEAYAGDSGTLRGVYRIRDLGFELWQDSIDPNSSSPDFLGSLQYLGTWRGWMVQRDAASGNFPTLAGEGLVGADSTLWPMVDTSQVGNEFNTPVDITGGVPARIRRGASLDDFDAPNNGGLALTDFSGDLGAWFDAVVVPRLPPESTRFVYLECAGFGINNSFDPVFGDTIGYDVVIVAANGRRPAAPSGGSEAAAQGVAEFGR